MVFLVAGGLFAFPVIVSGVNAVTGTEIAVSPAVIFTFMIVVFVGLLGLYPRLAERDSTLAKGGVGLLAVTAVITISGIGIFVGPTGLLVGETTALAIVLTVAVGSTLTVTMFGIGSLRTGAHSRITGIFLLVMAASVSFIVAIMLRYGHSSPDWVSVVVNGTVAMSLGSIGYMRRTDATLVETADSADDVAAS